MSDLFHKNRVSELFNIKYPIIEGGMAQVGDGHLAAAISNQGGLGQIAISGMNPIKFREELELALLETSNPIGVNIPISGFFSYNDYFDVIKEKKDRITAVSLSSGDPRPYIPFLKELGIKVMVVVGTVKHAVNAEKAGADLVICEGFEAGGRNSPYELTLFSLIPQVCKAVSIPVVAAGGISNGAGVLAAFALGADGVQIGTRFIATKECSAHDHYKKLLVQSKDSDTVVIERSIGGVNRVVKSEYVNRVLQLEKQVESFEQLFPYINGYKNKLGAIQGNLEEGWVHAGQSVGLIDSVISVEELFKEIVQEVNESYQSLFQLEPFIN
ncbi:NAD(P)H-dependent flavin oxidoreductase [Halalkalibacter krulwichiae]|uniref:Probable nitronate monooxygenase n=1 Tax=Halalkalibacter krulwichiae TaxID=199441 RepID=A0A1X9M8H4_9BACI|nr:nitronate monooxygenase family protein [Halalkalibacter krulwichiae]ARK28900.1 Nitronate monooxygenase [Halalkalibacter krulwichiae]